MVAAAKAVDGGRGILYIVKRTRCTPRWSAAFGRSQSGRTRSGSMSPFAARPQAIQSLPGRWWGWGSMS
jgi:hypothetical protein